MTSELLCLLLVFFLMVVSPAAGVFQGSPGDEMLQLDESPETPVAQRHVPPMAPSTPNPEDEQRIKIEHDMAKKANEERHAALKRDTDKLLQLSTELKHYVDKSNENTMSVEVIKKAEEIEKLAHSVKEKMKGN